MIAFEATAATAARNTGASVNRTFKDWIAEGDSLYQNALTEFRDLETQIEELERKLTVKREEVNEIARVVGKEQIDTTKRQAVEIVDRPANPNAPHQMPNSVSTIARAISGRINR